MSWGLAAAFASAAAVAVASGAEMLACDCAPAAVGRCDDLLPRHPHHLQGSSRAGIIRAQQEEEDEQQHKFAPRFDGLRFIETLVTAHR